MEDIIRLSKYYNWSMYQALLHATKYSLNQMKERICGRSSGSKKGGGLKPFFEVEVFLEDLMKRWMHPTQALSRSGLDLYQQGRLCCP